MKQLVIHLQEHSIHLLHNHLSMLLSFIYFGVTSVREFALPLMVGVIAGAYSSVCITSALWYVLGGKKIGAQAEEAAKEEKKKKAAIGEDGSQV